MVGSPAGQDGQAGIDRGIPVGMRRVGIEVGAAGLAEAGAAGTAESGAMGSASETASRIGSVRSS